MILVLKNTASEAEIYCLQDKLKFMGFESCLSSDQNHKAIAIISGIDNLTHIDLFREMTIVDKILPFQEKYKLAGRDIKKSNTVIRIKDKEMGDGNFTIMAGPCTIESKEQIFSIAKAVSERGATILRGGAFKPRTSPYEFQGMGEEGLQYLHEAADKYNMLCISEVMCTEDVPLVEQYVDILQIGARNMQNFNLLKSVGKSKIPVLLKRGFCATYKEFLLAAEYIMSYGNPNVILCERGIRTFETMSRNTLDIAAVPILREITHLPIIVDPSHGTGLRSIVGPMAFAAMAVKADGLILEVHTDPDKSICDAQQTISPQMFSEIVEGLRKIGDAVNIRLAGLSTDSVRTDPMKRLNSTHLEVTHETLQNQTF